MYTLIYMSFPLMQQFQADSKEEMQAILDKYEFRKCDCLIYKQGDINTPVTSEFKFKSSY